MKKEEIELNEVKELLRSKMIEKYGSVPKFLRSDDGIEFGGLKIKPYLYPAGPVSFETLSRLTKFFGLGVLSRKLHIVRTTTYFIKSNGDKK